MKISPIFQKLHQLLYFGVCDIYQALLRNLSEQRVWDRQISKSAGPRLSVFSSGFTAGMDVFCDKMVYQTYF